jgi:prevent-host-death family protein
LRRSNEFTGSSNSKRHPSGSRAVLENARAARRKGCIGSGLHKWDVSYILYKMTRLSTSQARSQFADVLDRVAFKGERVVIERRGKVLGAVVSADDLAILEQVRALEDEMDSAAVRRARREKGRIPWETIKRDLGLR